MRERLIKFGATGCGVGYLPLAPGLAGSVVGLGYWWVLGRVSHPAVSWLVWLAGLLFAVWCAGTAARLFGQKDPGCVVIDELVAVPLALVGLGTATWEWLVAFGLFRLFDVWKPAGIGRLQNLPGGWGIVADDLLAAVYAGLATHAVRAVAAAGILSP